MARNFSKQVEDSIRKSAGGDPKEDDKYIKLPGFSVLGDPQVGVQKVDPEINAQLQIEKAALRGAEAVPQGMEPQSPGIKPNRPMTPEEKNAAAEAMIREIELRNRARAGEKAPEEDDAALVRRMKMDAIREAAQSGKTGLPEYLKKY